MRNWIPSRKVVIGALVGVASLALEHLVPAWHNGLPVDVSQELPLIVAAVVAYLVPAKS